MASYTAGLESLVAHPHSLEPHNLPMCQVLRPILKCRVAYVFYKFAEFSVSTRLKSAQEENAFV
jgi:hypothetical protein